MKKRKAIDEICNSLVTRVIQTELGQPLNLSMRLHLSFPIGTFKFMVGETIVFTVPFGYDTYLDFVPIGANICELVMLDGSLLKLPALDGLPVRCQFPAGEVRLPVRSGNGALSVTAIKKHTVYNNARDFGAQGNGTANDTAAIQAAIDAGGMVYLPKGIYRCGTLYLQDNGGVTLAAGAEIVASPNLKDYNAPDFCQQNSVSKSEKTDGRHLIVAVERKNIHLRGFGVINGNRPAFFDPDKYSSRNAFLGTRPAQMLFLAECENVELSDLRLKNSPYWSCFLHGCSNVSIRGLDVRNYPSNCWNGDGIDIDCCKNVKVENCFVAASDDCITVRAANLERLKHSKGICEDVVIQNCEMHNGHCGVRFGVGTGLIRHCRVRDCRIYNTLYGIGVHSAYLPKLYKNKGATVEDILVENIELRSGSPFYISANASMGVLPESGDVYIKNVTLCNIRARGSWNCLIEGNLDCNISDVLLKDIVLEMHGGDEIITDLPVKERVSWRAYRYPCAIQMANVKNFTFDNVTLKWHPQASKLWLKAIDTTNCEKIQFINCKITEPHHCRK